MDPPKVVTEPTVACSSPQSQCAKCQKSASTRCQGCLGGIDKDEQRIDTYYCGVECQKAHWPIHKSLCKHRKARKQLYRAGQLARDAFYAYRERTFDLLVKKVEKRGNKIHVWEGWYAPGQGFAKFPVAMVPDQADKKALLTHLACSDANAYMYNLIRESLEGQSARTLFHLSTSEHADFCTCMIGIHLGIKEINLRAKDDRRIIFYDYFGLRDNADYVHQVFKITLKSGSEYALDLTSIQYGYAEPVVPWDRYLRERVTTIMQINEFGYANKFIKDLIAEQLSSGAADIAAIHLTHGRAIKHFYMGLEAWLKAEKTTLPNLLKSSEEQYREDSIKLRVHLAKEVCRHLYDIDSSDGKFM